MKSYIDPTINTYNLFDGIYDDETVEFWSKFPKTTINKFTKYLPGKRILNLGSGPGRDALLLRNAGLEVICVDAAIKMINRTSKLGFKSIQADFRMLNFPTGSFDGVWAFTSLLHISKSDVGVVLKNVHSILKNRGILLVGMIEGTYEGNKERDSMPNTYRYFKFYEEIELKTLITPLGFKFLTQERYKPHTNTYISQIYIKQ